MEKKQYVTWEESEQRRKALKKEKNKWLVLVGLFQINRHEKESLS